MSNETTNPVLQVKGLKYAIKGAEILKGIDFEVKAGDVVALTGFAGCGKTTLLRALPLFFVPDAGEIHFDGNLIFKNETAEVKGQIDELKTKGKYDKSEMKALKQRLKISKKSVKHAKDTSLNGLTSYRQNYAMTLQGSPLYPYMTVLKNITSSVILAKTMSEREANEKALELLQKVGLEGKAELKPHQLTHQEKHLAGLLRAFMKEPKILLCDDPVTPLPEDAAKIIMTMLDEYAKAGIPIIIAANDIAFAKDFVNRVLVMEDGVLKEKNPEEYFSNKPENDGSHYIPNLM